MQKQGKRLGIARWLLTVVFVSASVSALVSCAPADTGLKTLYGSWLAAAESPLQGQFSALVTLNADGGLVGDPPPTATESTSHGNWERTSATSANYTFVALITNEERVVVAFLKIVGRWSYDAGTNSWSGPYTATVTAPDGTVVGTDAGNMKLTRIAVEALP